MASVEWAGVQRSPQKRDADSQRTYHHSMGYTLSGGRTVPTPSGGNPSEERSTGHSKTGHSVPFVPSSMNTLVHERKRYHDRTYTDRVTGPGAYTPNYREVVTGPVQTSFVWEDYADFKSRMAITTDPPEPTPHLSVATTTQEDPAPPPFPEVVCRPEVRSSWLSS